ncbi:MAG: hypothetical protein ABW007_19450 [Chitinophagaceae bacterium]
MCKPSKNVEAEQLNPPLEIEIKPDGTVRVLDPDFLSDLDGNLTVKRTSEIIFCPERRQFYIRLLYPGNGASTVVSVVEFHFLIHNPPEGMDLGFWARATKVWEEGERAPALFFQSYEYAVAFEKWLIPAIRKHRYISI